MLQIIHGALNWLFWSFKCLNLVSPDVLYTGPYSIQPDPASLDQQGWLGSPTSLFGIICEKFWPYLGPNVDFFDNSKWSIVVSHYVLYTYPTSIQPNPPSFAHQGWFRPLTNNFWHIWATFRPPWIPILICREQQKVQNCQSWWRQHRSNLDPTRSSQFRPPRLIGTTNYTLLALFWTTFWHPWASILILMKQKRSKLVSPDIVYTDPTSIPPDPASLDHQRWLRQLTNHFC